MNLDMADISCSYDFVLSSGSYLESKASHASYISDTLTTVGYGTSLTIQPSSYNCSNWPSLIFFPLDKISSKASQEVFLSFRSIIRS